MTVTFIDEESVEADIKGTDSDKRPCGSSSSFKKDQRFNDE